jgi:alcohol dehydrogenase YqhD (iron-dependent ADH family)
LSGLFGVTHGAGLAAIWGSWARYVKDKHVSRFEKYAKKVMGVEGALAGIEATEQFFRSIGMPTSIPEVIGRKATDEEIATMVDKCSRGGKITLGAMEVLTAADMKAIYQLANG